MTQIEILEKLCYHDKRNPTYVEDYDDLDKIDGEEVCYCDNCFYGRTKMAKYILELLDKIPKNSCINE